MAQDYNDLYAKIVLDLEDKEAINKTKDFVNQLEKRVGKTFSMLKIEGRKVQEMFTPSNKSTDKLNFFESFIKDGQTVIKVIAKVNKETGKLQSIVKSPQTTRQLISNFNLDKSKYDGTLEAQQRASKIAQGESKFDALLAGGSTKIQQTRIAIASLKEEINKLRQAYAEANAEGLDTSQIETEALDKQKELNKQEKSLAKQTRVGPLQKLWNTFKRIGFYRIFREIFAGIKQGFQQGIQSLVSFDKEANKIMSSLASSTEKIFGGITLAVMPLLEMLTPVLDSISNIIVDIGNAISRASAESKGMTTYTKINKDYLKDSANEANKLLTSFDKFESLNAKESPYITGNVEEDKDVGLLSETKAFLIEIGIILSAFGTYEIVKWITSGDASKFFDKIKTDLPDIKGKISNIGNALFFIWSVKEVVDGIFELINNWDEMSLIQKIFKVIKVTLYGIGAIMVAIGTLLTALGNPMGAIVSKIGLSAVLGGLVTGLLDEIGVFGNGGIAEKGDLFIANDRGPELVYSGPNNSSSIMNIAQFKQSMVEALYEASEVFHQEQEPVILNLDGAEIARSRRLKSELNRTNAGLNLK